MQPVRVRILGISGSPIKGGNCDTLVLEALKSAVEVGKAVGDVETDFITLADKNVAMCKHCQWCIENRSPCKVEDDAKMIWEKIIGSDGLILGAPTWCFNLAPLLTILFSRIRYYAFFTQKLRNKVAGHITLGFFGWGLEHTLDTMENFTKPAWLSVGRAYALSSTAALGERPAYLEHGVLDDKRGIQQVRLVGIRVVEVARMIKHATEAGVVLPKEYTFTATGGHWDASTEKVFNEGIWRDA